MRHLTASRVRKIQTKKIPVDTKTIHLEILKLKVDVAMINAIARGDHYCKMAIHLYEMFPNYKELYSSKEEYIEHISSIRENLITHLKESGFTVIINQPYKSWSDQSYLVSISWTKSTKERR